MSSYTLTTNNGISLKTTNNPLIDFFMLLERNISDEYLNDFINNAWHADPIKTIAIIFNCRDRVNGKKEKNCSNRCILWIRKNYNDIYKLNIKTYIDKYGCWKDLVYISKIIKDNNYELKLFAKQLIIDKQNLENNNNISLCAKWAPSENKMKKLGFKIANFLYKKDKTKIMEKYRKEYLTPLRNKLNIIETIMCSKKWEDINYNIVPANAIKKYKKAFMKNDTEKYYNFLCDLKNNKKNIKITGILPYELVNYYIKGNLLDETIEMQWISLVDNIKNNGIFNNTVAIVDVSGSMFSTISNPKPIDISISLGLLIANCNEGFYKNKVITFSENAEIFTINGNTLFEQVQSILKMDAGYNTNFINVFNLIINNSNIPDKVICLTDMQFDNAASSVNEENNNIETIYENIKNKFIENNYNIPKFIFWNINSVPNTFPITSTVENTAIISGYSEQLLKIILKFNDFTPELILNEILEPYIKNVNLLV